MRSRPRIIPLLLGALLFFGLLLLLALGIGAGGGPLRAGPTPADPTIEAYMRQIRLFDQELQKTLPPDSRRVAEQLKQHAQEQIAERIEALERAEKRGTAPAYP